MPRDVTGVGVGVRMEFAQELLDTERQVDWLEITPENWMVAGGKNAWLLAELSRRWTIVPHSVSFSIGGPDPLDEELLAQAFAVIEAVDPPFWSDHLSYSRVGGVYTHDLLPLPFTDEAASHVAERAASFRSRLEVPLLLENPTLYAIPPGSEMSECEFIGASLRASGCEMLLDVNNVYVNSLNHRYDARRFIDQLPLEKVRQIHLAGHTRKGQFVIDTHRGPVPEPVWDLYRYVLRRASSPIPTLIEWDVDIPPLGVLIDEVERARACCREVFGPP